VHSLSLNLGLVLFVSILHGSRGRYFEFTIKVTGEETSGVLAFILPQDMTGKRRWNETLEYRFNIYQNFTTEDISARYFMYAYIKSSNDIIIEDLADVIGLLTLR